MMIANLGQRAYGRGLFQRFLAGTIVVVGLTMVIAMMVSATLLGVLYMTYSALLNGGLGSLAAMAITGIASLLIIAILAILALVCLHHLRQVPKKLLQHSPLTSRLTDAFDAFTDGLMSD